MTLSTVARYVVLIVVGLIISPLAAMAQEASGCAQALPDYRVALQSYKDGLLDPAIAGFDAFLQKCPEAEQAMQAHYLLGEMLYKRQRYTEALRHASQVVSSPVPSATRPQALLLAAECARQLGKPDQAESYLQQIVRSDLTSVLPAALYWLGELAFERQRPEAAMDYYKGAIRAQPSGPYAAYAHYALGWLYRQQGNAAAALEAFSALLKLAPEHEFALQSRFARAELWRQTGRLAEARQAFGQLVQSAPAEFRDEALFWLAETTYELGHYAEASTTYQRLVAEYPQSPRSNAGLYGWGWAEARQQRCATAVQPWETLVQRAPTFPQVVDVHYQLGLCYLQIGQAERAREHLRRVFEASKPTAQRRDAILKLATLAFRAKEYTEAIRYYTAALSQTEGEAVFRIHYLLGESYAALGDSAEAIRHWQQVVAGPRAHPLRASALFRIGSEYMAEQKWSEAISRLRRLWDEFPEFSQRTAVATFLVRAYSELQRCVEGLPFYAYLIDTAEASPQRQRVVGAKALCLFEAGQYADVIALLAPWLSHLSAAPREPQLLYILAQAYRQRQQAPEALTPLRLLHRYFPDHTLTLNTSPLFARLLEQSGQFREALRIWTAFLRRGAVQTDAELAKLRLHVGRLALRQGQFEQGLDLLAPVRAAGSAKLAAEALFWSAEAYFRQQRWDLALQLYQKILDQHRTQQRWSALARLRLGVIYEHQQDWQRALRTYQALLTPSIDEDIQANARQRIAAIESGRLLSPPPAPQPPPKG